MKSSVDHLSHFSLFRSLSNDELLEVATCMRTIHVGAGQKLFVLGDESDAAYIVVKGQLSAFLQTNSQVQEMLKFGIGSNFGELCLIKPGCRSLTITATTKAELLRIDRVGFENLRARRASGAYKVIRNICIAACDRLRTTNEFIEIEARQGEHYVQWSGGQPQGIQAGLKKFFARFLGE